jgi:hypothetical protein
MWCSTLESLIVPSSVQVCGRDANVPQPIPQRSTSLLHMSTFSLPDHRFDDVFLDGYDQCLKDLTSSQSVRS